NTCTEGGDSGGSWMSSTLAQGVTSGGAGYGANAVCGEKVGQPNVAYFQPVGEILSAYGLTLKTS
ncbi:MAG TPA: serine protease, partial [Pedococcus sp.]